MKANYTIQCIEPASGVTGCWLYSGESHRVEGSRISPIFNDLLGLFEWCKDNNWTRCGYGMMKG